MPKAEIAAFLLLWGCGTGPLSRSGLGQVPDAGGLLSGCDRLLRTPVAPKVFTPSAETRFTTCGPGTSDGLGNLAFAVQTGGNPTDPPGDARLYFLDAATGSARQDDLVSGAQGFWSVASYGIENGFVGVFSFEELIPSAVPGYRLTWFDHAGRPTGARQDSGSNPGSFQTALWDGRVFALTGDLDDPPNRTLRQYGPGGEQRWATLLPPSSLSITFVAGVDPDGNALAMLPAEGGGHLLWVSASGKPGVPFDVPTPPGRVLSQVFPRVEGGFFVLDRDADYPYTAHWAGQLAPGATALDPAPDWLPRPAVASPSNWFGPLPGRDGYAVMVDPPRLDVRAQKGELCGHVDLVPADGRIRNLGHFEIGADGTLVVTALSCSSSGALRAGQQLAATGAPVCTCAWQYWPGLLR